MKAKFTSGEWMVHLPTTRDGRLMVLHPDGERLICRLDEGFCGAHGPIPNEERIANARLIAAAPRLYRALEAVVAKGLTGVRLADFAEARAALVQADGGEV